MRPEPVALQLANKLTEATLEDVAVKTQETQRPAKRNLPPQPQVEAVSQPEVTVDGATSRTPASKPEPTKEEGPQDLRVFELNSDSGKSTPSNNGKKGTLT